MMEAEEALEEAQQAVNVPTLAVELIGVHRVKLKALLPKWR